MCIGSEVKCCQKLQNLDIQWDKSRTYFYRFPISLKIFFRLGAFIFYCMKSICIMIIPISFTTMVWMTGMSQNGLIIPINFMRIHQSEALESYAHMLTHNYDRYFRRNILLSYKYIYRYVSLHGAEFEKKLCSKRCIKEIVHLMTFQTSKIFMKCTENGITESISKSD